jgi:hypothetical protein
MGLDMFLNRVIPIYTHDYQISIEPKSDCYPKIDFTKVISITEKVAYWRKAHAIYDWFYRENNFSDAPCLINQDQIKNLVYVCKEVRDSLLDSPMITKNVDGEDMLVYQNTDVARELLPADEEWIFSQYDEWYMDHLQYTIDCLEPLIGEDSYGWYDYEFSASY